MKTALIAITKGGVEVALKLTEEYSDSDLYVLDKWSIPLSTSFESLSGLVEEIFNEYDTIVFIMATGIVVRTIAPFVNDKVSDPGIIVIDEKGSFVISLLSGHLGGANDNTEKIAGILQATAVITTASDIKGILAVDIIAQKLNAAIDNMDDAKRITSMMVNDELVFFDTSYDIFIPQYFSTHKEKSRGAILLSNAKKKISENNQVQLIPQNIVLGMGYKKEKTPEDLIKYITETLDDIDIDMRALKKIASVSIKAHDSVLSKVCESLGVENQYFTKDQINGVNQKFSYSQMVMDNVGVGGVCEPCAYLASNKSGKMILHKQRNDGMTLAVWEEDIIGDLK